MMEESLLAVPGAPHTRCNLCNTSFRLFLPSKSAPNAICPGCGSMARHRLAMLHFCHYASFLRDKKILHFAPESCFAEFFKNFPGYRTIDIAPGHDYQASMEALPFADEEFDFVIANHVFEHIENDLRAMSELHRVISKGGRGLVSVPFGTFREDPNVTDPAERERLFGQKDHVRFYDETVFMKRLQEAGFKTRISRTRDFPDYLQRIYALEGAVVLVRP